MLALTCQVLVAQKGAKANYTVLCGLNEQMNNGADFTRIFLAWASYVVNIPHSTPFLRLMRFGWQPTIDPVDFAGILNANALYSFTIGTPQLGFAIWFIVFCMWSPFHRLPETGQSSPLLFPLLTAVPRASHIAKQMRGDHLRSHRHRCRHRSLSSPLRIHPCRHHPSRRPRPYRLRLTRYPKRLELREATIRWFSFLWS